MHPLKCIHILKGYILIQNLQWFLRFTIDPADLNSLKHKAASKCKVAQRTEGFGASILMNFNSFWLTPLQDHYLRNQVADF